MTVFSACKATFIALSENVQLTKSGDAQFTLERKACALCVGHRPTLDWGSIDMFFIVVCFGFLLG